MPLLCTHNLNAFYGVLQALFSVDLEIERGELVALIGANGAGKSTLLSALVGAIPAATEAIHFNGRPVGGIATYDAARFGITLVPEGRRLFPSLTVEENLKTGGLTRRPGPWSLSQLYRRFPILQELRHRSSMTLSGGQQQILAIGRALMANPILLLCDELSLGLSPTATKEIYEAISVARAEGMTIVLVDQNVSHALAFSNRFYCLQKGRKVLSGVSSSANLETIAQAYFGAAV